MSQTATIVISDTSPALIEGRLHVIHFRPLRPGRLSVQSTPHVHDGRPRSELTPPELARMELHIPGHAKPIRSITAALSATSLDLNYEVAAADLTAAGDWSIRIVNLTLSRISFDSKISYPSSYQLHTASIDTELLNLLLSNVVSLARPSFHIESSSPDPANATAEEKEKNKKSEISWSATVAKLLPAPMKGTTQHRMHVDDPTPGGHLYRIVGLNSESTRIYVTASDELVISIDFGGQKAAFKAMGSGVKIDIDINSLIINLHVGFNGKVYTKCHVDAALEDNSFADYALLLINGIYNYIMGTPSASVSSQAQSEFEKKITEQVNQLVSQDSIKQAIDGFFIRLLRLEAVSTPVRHGIFMPVIRPGFTTHAKIQSYSADPRTGALIVTYYLVEEKNPILLNPGYRLHHQPVVRPHPVSHPTTPHPIHPRGHFSPK